MNYSSGEIAKIGDLVELWEGNIGTVVCSIDTNEYSPDYPVKDWSYLSEGILIMSEAGGLIHKTNSDDDLKFIKRMD